mmetsp:Transcript_20185/g.51193  ORF Transcript_20185/g.51193 Transcript_20185/m.51193 type:complete len:336 (-) Transcript_20185:306-1313(-)
MLACSEQRKSQKTRNQRRKNSRRKPHKVCQGLQETVTSERCCEEPEVLQCGLEAERSQWCNWEDVILGGKDIAVCALRHPHLHNKAVRVLQVDIKPLVKLEHHRRQVVEFVHVLQRDARVLAENVGDFVVLHPKVPQHVEQRMHVRLRGEVQACAHLEGVHDVALQAVIVILVCVLRIEMVERLLVVPFLRVFLFARLRHNVHLAIHAHACTHASVARHLKVEADLLQEGRARAPPDVHFLADAQPIFLGNHNIGKRLDEVVYDWDVGEHLRIDVEVVQAVVLRRVIDVRDLADVEHAVFLPEKVQLQLLPPSESKGQALLPTELLLCCSVLVVL